MKKLAIYTTYMLVTIILSLVIAFLAIANPQQLHGLQLPVGWEAAIPNNSIDESVFDLRICDISNPDTAGIPFSFHRPVHNDPTGCMNETNYIAIILNILSYVGTSAVMVYVLLIRPLKHTKLPQSKKSD